MTQSIKETLPWIYSGAYPTVNDPATIKRPYAIGAIVSEKLGCCVVAISFDSPDMDRNIANCDAAGKFIVECCNKTIFKLEGGEPRGTHKSLAEALAYYLDNGDGEATRERALAALGKVES
jgi:hypothetical protein